MQESTKLSLNQGQAINAIAIKIETVGELLSPAVEDPILNLYQDLRKMLTNLNPWVKIADEKTGDVYKTSTVIDPKKKK